MRSCGRAGSASRNAPPARMTASWQSTSANPSSTQIATTFSSPMSSLPSGSFSATRFAAASAAESSWATVTRTGGSDVWSSHDISLADGRGHAAHESDCRWSKGCTS
eukprot:2387946-Prymnesium_polylepis.1